jgi:cellulose synthase/poly-beta-1,6-N-acetylglucosamine synthase-like glycosyltransferase
MVLELLFWSSIALVLYAYAGYAGALALLALVRRRPVLKADVTPPVTFIITAHNEEARLADKLANTLSQDYPAEVMNVIVASDCSTDRTDEIASAAGPRVRLVRAAERRGKEAAQQLAIREATGDILVFSDVATALAPDGVSTIVRNFADRSVGCVSSVDRFVDADGRPSGEGAYVRYEMFLRRLETRVNTLVGLSGSFFAVRRELCDRWSPDRQSDFTTLLNTVDRGMRGVLDPESAGYYRNIVDERREFQRKVRTVVRGLYVLITHVRLLNPFRHGLFAWQLASHKLSRWLVPFALATALAANLLLVARAPIYQVTWLLQVLFYGLAAAGIWTRAPWLRLPAFLVISNAAILVAWLRFARGERFAVWSPSERVTKLPPASAR